MALWRSSVYEDILLLQLFCYSQNISEIHYLQKLGIASGHIAITWWNLPKEIYMLNIKFTFSKFLIYHTSPISLLNWELTLKNITYTDKWRDIWQHKKLYILQIIPNVSTSSSLCGYYKVIIPMKLIENIP